jgi:hypothetical protein
MRLLVVALLLLAAWPAAAAINGQAGTSGAQFLKLGAGGRAGAMADSFSAIADDAYAAYYNPAGLNQLKTPELGGAHTEYFQGINYEVIDFAYPWGKENGYSRHALSLGIYQLAVSDIQRFTGDTDQATGTFGASDGDYTLSYSYALDRHLSIGATGKLIAQSLDTYKSTAYAMDAGLLYRLNPTERRPVSVSAVIKNLGSRTGYIYNNTDPLPTELTLGLGAQVIPKLLKIDFEVSDYRDTNPFVSLGGEFTHQINEAVGTNIRFGYSTDRSNNPGLNGPTLGAGLTFKRASFDFAWVPFGDLGDTFRYSILVKF